MATGDILACRIASAARDNGWVAEIDIDNLAIGGAYAFGLGTNNDPSAAKIVFTVTSPGYDATGASTTIVRTVYGTQWERKPTPNQATADEAVVSTTLTVRVALSDFIYSGDTVTAVIAGGFYTKTAVPTNARSSFTVTNNSTLTHPACIGRWAWPAWEVVTGTFTLEAVCFHRSARAGKPVAAVVFSVTDGSTTVNVTATAMTVSSRAGTTGTGKVLVYKADFNASSFTQGAVLTANFTAYPWVGDSGATLTSASGITPPDERLCPHLLICDKNAAYGGGVAVVDSANGHNSTAATWIAASQSAAESAYSSSTANSYTTIGNAVQAIKAYNNANLSRNNPSGGVILLTGNHAWPGTSPADQGAQDAWVTITRLSTKTRSQCVINTGTNATLGTRRVKVLDVTLSGSSTGQVTGTGTTNVIWLDQCTINMTGLAPFYQWRMLHATRCDVTALNGGFEAFGGNAWPWALVRGCAFAQTSAGAGMGAEMYCVIGNRNVVPFAVWGLSAQASDNGIYAYNQTYFLNTVAMISDPAFAIASGIAIVQNVIERVTTGPSAMEIAAGNAAATTNNVIVWHNTFAGERFNCGYNDAGTVAWLHKNWSQVANVFAEWNNKDDTFTGTPNANRVGSWPVGYAVGQRGNYRRQAADPEWLGEFLGINSATAGALGFVSDASYNYGGGGGTGLGGGDYHLTPSGGGGTGKGLALNPNAVLPFDLEGTTRFLTGGDAGAYESQVALVPGGAASTTGGSASSASGRRVGQRVAATSQAAASLATGQRRAQRAAITSAASASSATGRRVSRAAAVTSPVAQASATGRRISRAATVTTAAASSTASGTAGSVETHAGAANTAAGSSSAVSGRRVSRSDAASAAGSVSAVTGRRVSRGVAASTAGASSTVTGRRVSRGACVTTAGSSSTASGTASGVPTHNGTASTTAGSASSAIGRRISRGSCTTTAAAGGSVTWRRISRGSASTTGAAASSAQGRVPVAGPPFTYTLDDTSSFTYTLDGSTP